MASVSLTLLASKQELSIVFWFKNYGNTWKICASQKTFGIILMKALVCCCSGGLSVHT